MIQINYFVVKWIEFYKSTSALKLQTNRSLLREITLVPVR